MALLVEAKNVVHHTRYPYMQVAVGAIFEMHDTFKATTVEAPQTNVVEVYWPMQALMEDVESALVHDTVVLPFVPTVLH